MQTLFVLLLGMLIWGCSLKERISEEPALSLSKNPLPSLEHPKDTLHTVELKNAYFDYDQWRLREDAKSVLRYNADWLKRNRSTRVQIEGYCDEHGSDEYNRELGQKRARTTKQFLLDLGIADSRLNAVGVGRIPGAGDNTRARNRRAGFIVFYE